MLSPLQERIAQLVATLAEAQPFALAGGAGLIVHRVIDRLTNDLDFFTPEDGAIGRLLPRLEAALAAAGLHVTRERSLDTFVRLSVTDGTAATVVDLARDYRMLPPVATAVGMVVAEEELAADKLLALAGRVEPRDYLDVSRLVQRHGLDALCRLAREKDPGFNRRALADMLLYFPRLARRDFDVDDTTYDRLGDEVASWRIVLQRGAAPPTREPPGVDL
jgi:hypothetical protein